jgi:hypothetical protein
MYGLRVCFDIEDIIGDEGYGDGVDGDGFLLIDQAGIGVLQC